VTRSASSPSRRHFQFLCEEVKANIPLQRADFFIYCPRLPTMMFVSMNTYDYVMLVAHTHARSRVPVYDRARWQTSCAVRARSASACRRRRRCRARFDRDAPLRALSVVCAMVCRQAIAAQRRIAMTCALHARSREEGQTTTRKCRLTRTSNDVSSGWFARIVRTTRTGVARRCNSLRRQKSDSSIRQQTLNSPQQYADTML
jgi:hypothetical protein